MEFNRFALFPQSLHCLIKHLLFYCRLRNNKDFAARGFIDTVRYIFFAPASYALYFRVLWITNNINLFFGFSHKPVDFFNERACRINNIDSHFSSYFICGSWLAVRTDNNCCPRLCFLNIIDYMNTLSLHFLNDIIIVDQRSEGIHDSGPCCLCISRCLFCHFDCTFYAKAKACAVCYSYCFVTDTFDHLTFSPIFFRSSCQFPEAVQDTF